MCTGCLFHKTITQMLTQCGLSSENIRVIVIGCCINRTFTGLVWFQFGQEWHRRNMCANYIIIYICTMLLLLAFVLLLENLKHHVACRLSPIIIFFFGAIRLKKVLNPNKARLLTLFCVLHCLGAYLDSFSNGSKNRNVSMCR